MTSSPTEKVKRKKRKTNLTTQSVVAGRPEPPLLVFGKRLWGCCGEGEGEGRRTDNRRFSSNEQNKQKANGEKEEGKKEKELQYNMLVHVETLKSALGGRGERACSRFHMATTSNRSLPSPPLHADWSLRSAGLDQSMTSGKVKQATISKRTVDQLPLFSHSSRQHGRCSGVHTET